MAILESNLKVTEVKEDWNVIYQLSLKSFVFECLMADIIRVYNFPQNILIKNETRP